MLKMAIIFSVPTILILYFSLLFVNEMGQKNICFGIRIPFGYEKREDLKGLKKSYKINFTLYTIVLAVIQYILMFSLPDYGFPIFIIFVFVFPVFSSWVYYQIHLKVKKLKKEEAWVLDNKNKVIVDLSYRNNKKEKVSVSGWWFLIPAYMCVVGGIIAEKYDNYMFFSFQVLITAIIYFTNKLIIRAKQNINGGEVNKIIAASKRFRYKMIKLNLILLIVMNISFLIMSILFVTYNESESLWLIAFGITIIPSFYALWYSVKISRERHNTILVEENENGKILINRDDDDNYKFGMFYYNKQDPALMVEKRVGSGWDFNYAKTPAKIFAGFTAAIIIGVIGLVTFMVPASMEEAKISLKDNYIKIDQKLYDKEIKYSNIEEIKTIDKIDKNLLFKTDGSAVDNLFIGNFSVKNLGKAKLYIMNNKKEIIQIKLKDNTYVMINFEDTKKTQELLENISNRVEN